MAGNVHTVMLEVWHNEANAQRMRKFESVIRKACGVCSKSRQEKVLMLAAGVLANERRYGLRYCPCRMITGRREEDLKLICPCNFKIQKTWREGGEWCSLFVKAK